MARIKPEGCAFWLLVWQYIDCSNHQNFCQRLVEAGITARSAGMRRVIMRADDIRPCSILWILMITIIIILYNYLFYIISESLAAERTVHRVNM